VLSGSSPVALLALSNMVAQIRSGHITGILVFANQRSPLFPDLPTLAEVRPGENYPSTWFGLFAPAGTPTPIVKKVAGEVTRIVANPAFRQKMFVERAVEPGGQTLDEFARFIVADRANAGRVFKESGLQPQ
jgi:tripartite-type tricarboxylate transporter receptor subunit TctC